METYRPRSWTGSWWSPKASARTAECSPSAPITRSKVRGAAWRKVTCTPPASWRRPDIESPNSPFSRRTRPGHAGDRRTGRPPLASAALPSGGAHRGEHPRVQRRVAAPQRLGQAVREPEGGPGPDPAGPGRRAHLDRVVQRDHRGHLVERPGGAVRVAAVKLVGAGPDGLAGRPGVPRHL